MAMLNNQLYQVNLGWLQTTPKSSFAMGLSTFVHSPAKLICDVLQGIWLAMCDSPALVAVAVCFLEAPISGNRWLISH